jgi:hypothetical protein
MNFPMPTGVGYADPEVRGRLRQWKQTLRTGYARYNHVYTQRDTLLYPHIRDFCDKQGKVGRQRAFARLAQRIGATGAVLEGVRLDGRFPIAVWSLLQPRGPVTVEPTDPSDGQNCIAVNYVLCGRLTDTELRVADGIWGLEVPDHALGRLLHRQPDAGLDTVLRAAHHAALRLRIEAVIPEGEFEPERQFLLPAGPGAFVCQLRFGPDRSDGHRPGLHVLARTWLSDDQLRPDQTPLRPDDGAPGDRLGDGWLLPAPLRHGAKIGTHAFALETWAPGLPAMLAQPVGRA